MIFMAEENERGKERGEWERQLALGLHASAAETRVRKNESGGGVPNTEKSVAEMEYRPEKRLPVDMNQEELNTLFAECLPKLQKAARRMIHNAEDSEDVVQEALITAFRKLHQFEGRSSFSTWLHSIVRNASRMYYRKAKARPAVVSEQQYANQDGDAVEGGFVDPQPSPEEVCAKVERSEILTTAAKEIPEKYRAAIYLFYRLGLGEEATAEALGITVSSLKAQLHRSRILLSWWIRRRCMPDAAAEFLFARPSLHGMPRVRRRKSAGGSSSVGPKREVRMH
jgi:RNA polymerase sigma factor (sigma-70 family)